MMNSKKNQLIRLLYSLRDKMIENEEFEWNEFIIFGNKFLNDDDSSVKQRTGISRFYYGAFCSSKDFIKLVKEYSDLF